MKFNDELKALCLNKPLRDVAEIMSLLQWTIKIYGVTRRLLVKHNFRFKNVCTAAQFRLELAEQIDALILYSDTPKNFTLKSQEFEITGSMKEIYAPNFFVKDSILHITDFSIQWPS